ncbi:MAG: trypsin-like peptidase domain-containing protein [Bacteroidetes bacterium]|nr:trypsin-like peptidase domain-containing protein [Bacteroidota bacterium]
MRTTDWFDKYLFGELSAEESREFDARLKSDSAFAEAFQKHQKLIETFNQHEQHQQLKSILKTIHQQEFGKDAKIVSIKEEGFIKKHGKTLSVAASVGIIAVLSTIALLSTGGYLLKQQNDEMQKLSRKIDGIESSQGAVIDFVTKVNSKINKPHYAPATIEGTGFALNNKGYFMTSLHTVKNADSVFVTNNFIERQTAKLVFTDPELDVAIYKIDNNDVLKKFTFPLIFKESTSGMGESVFTLGFPREDIVYGEGSLSSTTGYHGDTTMYQMSIPVNPGNSGGPLMDEQGNVIGLVCGKQDKLEGTGFAVKTALIKQSIERSANDSLKKELSFNTKKGGSLKNLKRSEQIKKIQPFVFNVMVYKK